MTDCNCDSPNPSMGPWHAIGCCRLYEVCTCRTVVTGGDRVKQVVIATCPLHVTLTASEVKVLTETATRVALELGRREAQQAIQALVELVELKDGPRDAGYEHRKPLAWQTAREILRSLASLPSGATSDATSGVPRHSEVSEHPQGLSNRNPEVECSCYKLPRLSDGILRHHPDCPNSIPGTVLSDPADRLPTRSPQEPCGHPTCPCAEGSTS